MDILILGASTVGTSVAETLCRMGQNVVIVDKDAASLQQAEERLDVSTLQGNVCEAVTLFQAGAISADLCLAVTHNDEVNLIGASLARAMGCSRSIARMFRPSFLDHSTFDYQRHFGIDRLISLEFLTALELAKAIRLPGLYGVESFARGELEVQEVLVDRTCAAVSVPLRELKLPVGVRVGLISRGTATFIPGAEDSIQKGDHVTLFGMPERIEEAKGLFEQRSTASLRVLIAGGGEIGYQLARLLEKANYDVTLLESNPTRARYLSEKLSSNVLVLNADATSKQELQEARVDGADVFVGSTGRDADNIVTALEARELGCPRVMGVVRKPDYTDILVKIGLDSAVSPREVMETLVRGYVNDGPVISKTPLADGGAELWEVEIPKGARCVDVPLKEMGLTHSLIAAVIRDDFVSVPGADDTLKSGDVAVVLVQTAHASDVLKNFEKAV